MKRKNIYILALMPFLALILMYEIVPLLTIIIESFQPDKGTGFTLENYHTVFTKLLYQKAIENSFFISLISSFLGILIGFLGTWSAEHIGKKFRKLYMTILNMVSNFAGVPLAFAYMILLGNAGLMVQVGRELGIEAMTNFDLYTKNGMTLIYVYFQVPLASLLIAPAFAGIKKEWKEASLILGGGTWSFWTKIGIPIITPTLIGTFSVLYCNALAAYATAYALMMNGLSLLPIQVAGSYVGDVQMRRGLGGALSVVMMIMMVVVILLNNRLSKNFQKGRVKA